MFAIAVARIFGFAGHGSARLLERNSLIFGHTWIFLVSGFFEPMFLVLGIGFGMGALIGAVPGNGGTSVAYPVFVAPGLIAMAVVTGVVYDMHNVFFRLRYERAYESMVTTPLSSADVAIGEVLWAMSRGALYAAGSLIVMFALGLVPAVSGILALPASVLIGFAAGGCGLAAVTFMRTRQDLDWFGVATLPLFLFSGTFYPITTYPDALRIVVELTPVYRAVDLVRGLTLGVIGASQAVDILYLSVLGALTLILAARRLRGVLVA